MVMILALSLTLFPLTKALAASTSEGNTHGIEPESFQYLACGISTLDFSGNTALCYGRTEAQQVVDYIAVTVTLQRWNGSSWVNVASYPFSKSNTSVVEGYKGVTVTRGYQYRVKSFHKVTHDRVTEITYSYSQSKYLS
ncbi:MAG: DUF6147 family protein [Bacillota bacterium]|nr:DUF6147 family protein [Bacillota bacterium]